MPEAPHANNQRTVADYERTARDYVDTVDGKPSASDEALRRLTAAVTPGTLVLEVGSGPGCKLKGTEGINPPVASPL